MESGEAPDRDCNRSWECERDCDAGSGQGPEDDVETRCAQRAPDRALVLFLTRTDDEEVSCVDPGDDEYERDRSQKRHECEPGPRTEVVVEKRRQRHRVQEAPVGAVSLVGGGDESVELRFRLGAIDAGLQATDHKQIRGSESGVRRSVVLYGSPELDAAREIERLGHDPDDHERLGIVALDSNLTSDDASVTGEESLSQTVAEHNDAPRCWKLLLR